MKRLLILWLALAAAGEAFAWGQKGHDVTAYIAECHLTPTAAAKVDAVLGGHSPVYYANWLDNASHTPEYAYSLTWHYLNIDEGKTLATMPRNPKGDILTALTDIVARLRAGASTPEQEALDLRMLIHLLGDLHCPMHAGRLSDLGGNRRPVLMFSRPTNLHSVWDTDLPEAAHRWSYTEWQQQIDRLDPAEAAALQEGDLEEWLLETQEICQEIYGFTPEGSKISYDYIAKYAPVIERQFLRGGLRLARLLNEIYR